MAIQFTDKQQTVLNARSHNIIVSAAAGSGKTAVLVERIIRMITEPNPVTHAAPLDIDRLLVVTFTRAAAAQMRERIGTAIAQRLAEHPDDRHLQRQETLLHHAQIMTIDSFCAFLLRNNFSDIDLDPGFRQMDDTEARLLRGDVWEEFLAQQYENADPAFHALVNTWCKGSDDSEIGNMVVRLVTASESHPDPIRWLLQRRADYDIEGEDDLLLSPWYADMLIQALRSFQGWEQMLQAGERIATRYMGPAAYAESFENYRKDMFAAYGMLDPMTAVQRDIDVLSQPAPAADGTAREQMAAQRRLIRERILQTLRYELPRLKTISKKDPVDPVLKQRAADLKKAVNDQRKDLAGRLCGLDPALQVTLMQRAAESLHTLVDLAIGFTEAFRSAKAEKGAIDFGDLERLALNILLKAEDDPDAPGGVRYTAQEAARSYRAHYDEIMIDEYQDSNEVQELLLSAIAGEMDGRYARFMVGDVKQSIYRFRNARPEIFVDKLDHYTAGNRQTERIDLDQNFRSRAEVLDATNDIFLRIMRREIGGVTYDDQVTLKQGAVYPMPDASWESARGLFGENPYKAQLLLIGDDAADDAADPGADEDSADAFSAGAGTTSGGSQEAGAGNGGEDGEDIREMTSRKKEALAIAIEIKRLVGTYPVLDDETHQLRAATYRDIVVLLRSGGPWNDAIREIFEREGIPLYVDYKTGYFGAEEIREVLQALRVIDNPAQDIPLYGMMRGYFGQFTQDELGRIRAAANAAERIAAQNQGAAAGEPGAALNQTVSAGEQGAAQRADLLAAVRTYTEEPALAAKCAAFLQRLTELRAQAQVTPIHQFLAQFIAQTGYEDYVTVLPAGAQRRANLQSLIVKAAAFEQTQYAGLFEFLRYLDSMRQYNVDYGEANVLDEKADVVRLMTIHKSKGLEFPIVFVAGLKGQFAYKGKDTSGLLLIDPDLGIGLDYIDPQLRVRTSTLRKAAVADRISRSSLGEELRVLYVAMTRAKERLYLSGYVGDIESYRSKIAASREAILSPEEPLPVQVITAAGNYLDLVMLALDDETRIDVREIVVSDMKLSEAEAGETLLVRRQHLIAAREQAMQELPVPVLAADLDVRFSYQYPHAELAGLYTKCSVSDIKHGIYEQLAENTAGIGSEPGGAMTDAAVELYEIPPEEDADIPRFAREAAGGQGSAGKESTQMPPHSAGKEIMQVPSHGTDKEGTQASLRGADKEDTQAPLRGAARGTAIHRILQLVDYRRWSVPADVSAGMLHDWAEEILEAGLIPRAYRSVLTSRTFLPFLHSGIAARMAAAQARGTLRREQPFVLGVPSDIVNPAFPHQETMLVQGIIDAFWIEETPTGSAIVIVDYKTDVVRDPQELIDRYDMQLRYYAQALSRILHLPVQERILYSFRLQQEIVLPPM